MYVRDELSAVELNELSAVELNELSAVELIYVSVDVSRYSSSTALIYVLVPLPDSEVCAARQTKD